MDQENNNGKKYSETLRNFDDPIEESPKKEPKKGIFVIAIEQPVEPRSPSDSSEKNSKKSLQEQELEDPTSPRIVQRNEERIQRIQSTNLYSLNSRDLLIYFLDRFHHQHGYEYRTDWDREHGVFTGFKKRYEVEAGPLVAHVFDVHHGYLEGELVTVSDFSVPRKYVQDKWYFELQGKKTVSQVITSAEGLLTANEFLQMES